ncbi:MAG: glycosyltransferase [Nitrospira sp.]|nr:glycosyltransferase [Nitrospira sp.]
MSFQEPVPLISVIIPVLHLSRPVNPRRFFSPRYTIRDVLRDVWEHITIPFEVIIVCNGDDPALIDFVRTDRRIDKYCLNSVNAGVARSWNMGAQLAEGSVLCFLNDDVSIGPGALEALYETLHSSPDIGQVGPVGARWRGAEHERFVGEEHIEDADAIAGFCFLVWADLYRRIGGFDVAYSPAGFEEIDFSFAVRHAGFRCVVVPKLAVRHYHHHGVSAYKTEIRYLSHSIDTVALHERNKAYFMAKWGIGHVA